MRNPDVWIGLVEVMPRPGNDALGKAKGAFVNVVALGSTERDYKMLVEATMAEYGFFVKGCRDIARLEDWKSSNRIHPELEQLAEGLTRESPIQFDEFQSYLHENDA